MANIDPFILASGDPILYRNDILVRQPTLRDIRAVGYHQYRSYLSVLMLQSADLLRILNIGNVGLQEPDVHIIIGAIPDICAMFVEALSFFVPGNIEWKEDHFEINGNAVDSDALRDIKQIIFQVSYLAAERQEERKFANEAARKLAEKLRKGRQQFERAKKTDVNMDIPNLICAVAAEHHSYNLLNIWELTVYQLYDQFSRINVRVQMDIYGQRWAAWGKESFDTSMWFKSISKKEGN